MLLEMNNQSLFSFFLSFSLLIHQTRAHGYLASPRSRNFVAHEDGLGEKQAPVPGAPYVEYCHACLTRNAGVCGLSIHDHNYDDWLDSTGSPMPWKSQATYEQGGIVRINTIIKAHHLGHIEVSACPDGRASTQECFDQHRLTFAQDIAHGMPADPKHPERGYLSLGEEFSMDFKLPDNVSGENVLLQWRYISANSCNPADYHDYFRGGNADNEILPEEYWNSILTVCNYPLPLDGSRGFLKPEQFFNCAEITILPSSTTPVETAEPEISSVALENSPGSSSIMQALTNRINSPDAPATAAPAVQETTNLIDSSVTEYTASPTISPTTRATSSPTITRATSSPTTFPMALATSVPTASPVVPATSNPVASVETKVATNSPVNTAPIKNDIPENGETDALAESVEIVPEESHNENKDDTTKSIIEQPGNSVQSDPLNESDVSTGSRSLPSILVLSLVLIVQKLC
ncbi:hypothetical protein FisN_11Lh151 [Fistulifera solaris]|uniref:Chitin-binding type-4 domain-containing protein n=1 Tax=Fistulifera solaris TaxID=1519565 RepID=A0A1Z5J7S0_FISSO|nr:hypothetical protein FisN_11Lh151 [Fistulifera solaris]|eukprot:GAX09868.1 hypothetical protein FisN_11Lh151 [Fistulifera solaris]